MSTTLVFDVNETLLDLAGLDEPFQRYFADPSVKSEWFNLVLRGGMTATMIGCYRDFTAAGAAALQMVARSHGIDLDKSSSDEILGTMARLAPHPEVASSLSRLADRGYPLAALTNSVLDTAKKQLTYAGIAEHFQAILSADSAGALKPAARVYRHACAELDIETRDMWMVAAHDWDIAGAMAVGCHGIFIARPGKTPSALFPKPDLVFENLADLADRLEREPLS